jgi:hypothetical protein
MNAIILKGAVLRQPPLPQSGPRAKTIAHPCSKGSVQPSTQSRLRMRCRFNTRTQITPANYLTVDYFIDFVHLLTLSWYEEMLLQ